MALAIWLYPRTCNCGTGGQIVGIGLCLPAALKRLLHYSYEALAFVAAIVLHTLFWSAIGLRTEPAQSTSRRLHKGLPNRRHRRHQPDIHATVGRGSRHVTGIDWSTLYASFIDPPAMTMSFFIREYGWGVLLVVAIGYVAGLVRFLCQPPAIAFSAMYGASIVLIWLFAARQRNITFNLHFLIATAGGVILAFWAAWRRLRPPWRTAA